MSESKIHRIISALLAKAESTDSQAERETFMGKALELMEKHQIEAFELHEEDPLGMTEGVAGQPGPASYKPMVQRSLARFYGAKVVLNYTGSKKFTNFIFGPESSRMTTVLMTPFVWAQVCAQGRAWARDRFQSEGAGIRQISKALCHRIAMEIAQRVRTPETEKTAFSLTVVNNTDALIKHHYGDSLKDLRLGQNQKPTFMSAFNMAKDISISPQLGKGGDHKRLQ